MKLREAIIMLLGVDDNKPIPSILHLASELFLIDRIWKIEKYDATKSLKIEMEKEGKKQ